MGDSDKLFTGSIPEIYERYMVPLLFATYARDLAERVALRHPADVLETAAGTGALTRELAAKLASDVRIVATDLNQPMIDRALAASPESGRVAWRQADAHSLPFQDASFDAVVCQFGAMFFPDKVQGYKEARRVLRSGGAFLFNVWDSVSENIFIKVVSGTLAAAFPHDPPTFAERIPHGYFDLDRIREHLRASDFGDVTIETLDRTSTARSARDVAVAFCQGTPLRTEILTRDAARLEEVTEMATVALTKRFGSGPVEGPMRAHVISAVR